MKNKCPESVRFFCHHLICACTYGSGLAQPWATYSVLCPSRPVIQWWESSLNVIAAICLKSVCIQIPIQRKMRLLGILSKFN